MTIQRALSSIALLCSLAGLSSTSAQAPAAGKGAEALKRGAAENKTVYLLFYKVPDEAAKARAQPIKAQVAQFPTKAIWSPVCVTDAAEKGVVDKFELSRAPVPLVLAVNPNGAVTGVFADPIGAAELNQCLVSPKKAECMKVLQQNHLVLLFLQTSPLQLLPKGVQDLRADAHFSQRTQVVSLHVNEPEEAAFVAELQANSRLSPPYTVMMAPPGVLVGKFLTSASKDEMAAALGKAGKCCDDPNCKHNKQ